MAEDFAALALKVSTRTLTRKWIKIYELRAPKKGKREPNVLSLLTEILTGRRKVDYRIILIFNFDFHRLPFDLLALCILFNINECKCIFDRKILAKSNRGSHYYLSNNISAYLLICSRWNWFENVGRYFRSITEYVSRHVCFV